MTYNLPPHLHAAVVGDSLILLDVTRDRYQMLGPASAALFRSLAANQPVSSLAALEALLARGILRPASRGWGPPTIVPATQSAIEMDDDHAVKIGIGTVAHAVLRAMAMLRLSGFSACLDVSRRRSVRAHSDQQALIAFSQAYMRSRRVLPLKLVCLRDSLALHDALSRARLPTSLVIAVRDRPFGAHCWVQAGSLVLNDSCDSVAGYTPILVI